MKYIVLLLLAALMLTFPFTQAFSMYNSQTRSYQPIGSWSPSYTYQPSHYVTSGRPEGYGLIRSAAPYPPRGHVTYCDRNDFIGHTSSWTPGRYYSGLDGQSRPSPMQRSTSDRCAPQRPLNLNTFQWYY